MQHDKLIQRMAEIFSECLELARDKNQDYAKVEDALSNFRDFGRFGVVVRMNDKMERIKNLVKKDPHIQGETIADSFRDLANYAVIAIILGEEK